VFFTVLCFIKLRSLLLNVKKKEVFHKLRSNKLGVLKLTNILFIFTKWPTLMGVKSLKASCLRSDKPRRNSQFFTEFSDIRRLNRINKFLCRSFEYFKWLFDIDYNKTISETFGYNWLQKRIYKRWEVHIKRVLRTLTKWVIPFSPQKKSTMTNFCGTPGPELPDMFYRTIRWPQI